MKKKISLLGAILIIASLGIMAQNSDSDTELLSSKLGLFVFPSNDQSKEQQEKDEFECYKWAVEQSGVDPISPPEVEAAHVETGPDGGGVRGSARGAAGGAAIGAIAGDAGKGAAIGATVGGVRGTRSSVGKQQQQVAQAEADAIAAEKALMDSFIKAFSVCLEGKGYVVSK